MRVEHFEPGRPPPARLVGAVLTHDVALPGRRLSKGRRLTREELDALASAPSGAITRPLNLIVLEEGDVHEDEAALRLASAVAGACVRRRGPSESRVDLLAEAPGVADVNVPALERLNRIDPVAVFTVLDGQTVAPGDIVASIKVAPHVVAEAVLAKAESVARRSGPIVGVAAFRPHRVAVIAKEHLAPDGRRRFEGSVRDRIESLGSSILWFAYVEDSPEAVEAAFDAARRDDGADLILTAGAVSTDPADAVFVALARQHGRVVRHGAPSHPGSMLWLGRIGRTPVLGLPSCGAFSKATAADLLLPRLLAGAPVSAATVARLAHGGILTRDMRFRFPPYARSLEPPTG